MASEVNCSQIERSQLAGTAAHRRVPEVIAESVRRCPDAVALRIVDAAGTDVWTYQRLWDRVCSIRDGAFADLAPGSRVVLAKAGDGDYVAGFVAALAAGLVAVPLFLPSTDAPDRFLRRAEHVLRDCDPSAVYTSADLVDTFARTTLLSGLAIRTADSAVETARSAPARAAAGTADIAFLQYSSGSTGEPKGIVNTHASMLHQLAIALALWNRPDDIHTVSWLPLYHDLGIFWGVLLALGTGGTATLISPFDFVRNPRIWLETVDEVRGNWIAGPDFSYRLCLDAFDDAAIAALDLSCLHLAISGAEPVRASTLRDFAARFGPAGLRAEALAPQYGLAEAGLAVSGTVRPRLWMQASFDAEQLNRGRAVKIDAPCPADRRTHTLVSCGDSTLGWDVRIVDPKRRTVLPDGRVGEIWVGGAGLPDGYWRRPQQTTETFGATTADGLGPYLRTGDAGFRDDGELYICGRYRDLIIVGGGNYFPNDIEVTVEGAHCGVAGGGACAVQPEQAAAPGEWWVIAETNSPADDLEDFSRVLQRRILAAHQIAPQRIVWVRPRTLPRTTSGKIRRRKALHMLTAGEFDVVHQVSTQPNLCTDERPSSELARCVAGLLGVSIDELERDTDLTALGLTSMMTAQVVEWAATRRRHLEFADLYAEPTLEHWQRLFDAASPVPTSLASGSDTFALTALQRAYWVGRDAGQPLGAVGCQTYFELEGTTGIDCDRLGAALDALAGRHPMLRSMFPDADQGRVAAGTIHPPLRVHDLTGATDTACDHHLDVIRNRLRTHRFDIESGDTWRVELTRIPGRCILHFAINLIIADLTSIGIFLRDLAALYRGEELPPVSAGVGRLRCAVTSSTPADTAERLPEGPQLPRAVEHDIAFRRRQHRLDPVAVATIDTACRAHAVTRAAVFLAAYTLVLRRWSSTDDFLVNVTTFGRPPGVSDVIGDFTATHLYRAQLVEPAGFAEQARSVQRGLRAALRAPESTELLAAQLRRGTGHSGLAPVVFTYAADSAVLAQRDIDTLGAVGAVVSMTPQVIIDNQITALGNDLIVSWDYRSGCFPPGVVEDMFDAYVAVLESLGDHDWSAPVAVALPEHSRMIRQRRNATAVHRPGGLLHDRFREQAGTDPERIALRWAAGEFDGSPYADPIALAGPYVSYGMLDEYARRIAAALADRHAPGSIIGIRLPKGPAQVAAVLGVLMAGCSYLPIGVDQPPDRVDRICALSGLSGLIGPRQLLDDATCSAPVVHDIEAMIECAPIEPVRVPPDSAAYVIYTSGSTGEPKGVRVSHAAALNTILDVNRRNNIGATDRVLALSALDFDLSVYDIFGPLSCGASVVTIAEQSRRDAFRWHVLLTEFAVTVWNSVPALLDMLLIAAGEQPGALASLRSVFLSGDWIALDIPARLRHVAPEARLVAMGGATEAAIWSNEFVVAEVDPDWVSIPYGYPLSNQMFRVADSLGRDCPDYVAGELWIGGAGVALGYHNAPELTAERFVVDESGQRWYRTGDLGCYWRDGTLQFLGRADSQVKIGGHRVECGEIEHVLRGHPWVDNAAVVPIRGNMALGAVIVGGGAAAELGDSAASQLSGYLSTRLPQYMVPRVFVVRAELPLTGNGKIDRRQVSADVENAAKRGTLQTRTGLSPVEQVVADVWSEVLGSPITGRDDNFFARGGDSLCATQVAAALKRRGVLGADVGHLFARQTLGEFSAGCIFAAPQPAGDGFGNVGLGKFPLTRLQQAYVLGSAGMNGSTCAPTFFAIVLESTRGEDVDLDRFAAVVACCVDEFDVLRCALDTDTSQRVHAEVAPARITIVEGAHPDALMRAMAAASYDPRAVPVLRCYALAGTSRYVGMLVNYLSLDARSLAVVIATIVADYQRLPRPRPVDRGAGVFARYAAESLSADFTLDRAVSAPPTLPAGRALPTSRVDVVRSSFTLDASVFTGLREHAAQLCVTPTALIFEAFADALYSIGAGERFAIVVPVSHRPEYAPPDREVLGNFTRLALCDVDYRSIRPGSPEAVRAVQEQLWRAVGSATDATGQLAALRSAGSPGYPVVFTSTLGLAPQGPAELTSVGTLTQTPGVWVDCQVEDHAGGARISWDTAVGVVEDDALVTAFARFESAVRRHVGQGPEAADAALPVASRPADSGWAGAVIAAAAGLCHAGQIRPEYAALVTRWRQSAPMPTSAAPGHDVERAARRLADIVTGAASPQTLIGDPQLAPEEMLLAEHRLHRALDELCERIFGYARDIGRRLRVVEVGARTGLVTARLTDLIGAVVEEYLCFEPNPVLAQIAAGRRASMPTRQITSPEQTAATPVDVAVCCGSLHQLPDPGAVLDRLAMADGGWLWLVEICEVTAATLASAAVVNPGLLSAGSLRTADQWWRFLAEHRWQPIQMVQDGPGVTIVARREPSIPSPQALPGTDSAASAPATTPARIADDSTLATIAAIWQRHLDPAGSLPAADDDFFLLGGDSLAATRVYADLQVAGFTGLSLVDLFNYPVLGELAAQAGTPTSLQAQPDTPSPPHDDSRFPLTAVQRAYLAGRVGGFLLSGVAAHCYFEFEAGDFDRSRFETAARQLVQHHPGLRTTVSASSDSAVVHPNPLEPVVSDYDDVRAQLRDQVIDLTTRPGIDFGIQSCADGRVKVGISMDNVMLDGTSMMIALAQLDYLYRGGRADELPSLPTTFEHYLHTHPELQPDADESALPQLAASRDYWRARLPSLPPAPQLAPMQVLLDIDKPVFERVEAVLCQADWSRITQACRGHRVTAASFLLANYARVLADWAGAQHFCVNVTLFDRDPGVAGIEHVIGDFTSLLLVECHVDANLSIWEQARRLQAQLITDLPHRAADAIWLQRELLRYHGRPADAIFPVVFTSGLGLIDTSGASQFGSLVFGCSQTPQTLLDFQMWEKAGSLSLSWDFVTQAIAPEVARRRLDMMVQAMISVTTPVPETGRENPFTGDAFAERVAEICAGVLGVPRVERCDNFFQLGGDSVAATRVVEALSREVSPTASLRLLFENPVIGEFAEKIRSIPACSGTSVDAAIEEGVL
ncbi:non-ribosomal peptide synthetase [Mycobacterium sp.]|uniref:non-ribosomal peptide synthetase n=1 Tax=Mycobacterium sp. TaxID=1785 RepID=UPI0012782E3F|nr:non-ribosomal peptide synthetase [Mycobacterium sp.]KAA8965444.1 MAG: amino acid adenylation domain-containing protein [Mycobacterium sp.]